MARQLSFIRKIYDHPRWCLGDLENTAVKIHRSLVSFDLPWVCAHGAIAEVMDTPHKNAKDSPSKQLLKELNEEVQRQEIWYTVLEQAERERSLAQRAAIAAAKEQHDLVRARAVFEFNREQERLAAEQRLRDQQKAQEFERARKEQAQRELEAERARLLEAQAAEEAERLAAEEKRANAIALETAKIEKAKREAEEIRIQEQQRIAAQRASEEAEARAKAAALAARSAQKPAIPQQVPNGIAQLPVQPPAPSILGSSAPIPFSSPSGGLNPKRVEEHSRYLKIHQNLKALRKSVVEEGNKNKALKSMVGDARRNMRKKVSQLTADDKEANKKRVS